MNVFVEGLDKTGKTTLIKNLLSALNDRSEQWKSYRTLRPQFSINIPKEAEDKYYEKFSIEIESHLKTVTDFIANGMIDNIIFDRFHLTEYSYLEFGEVKDFDYIWEIDKKLARSNSKLIFLNKPLENIIDSFDGFEKAKYNEKSYARYYERMKEAFQMSVMKKWFVTTDLSDEEETLNMALMFIRGK